MPNKRTKNDKDHLPAKPPEILQKLKWLHIYGGKYKKYIIVAFIFIVVVWSVKLFLYIDRGVELNNDSSPILY